MTRILLNEEQIKKYNLKLEQLLVLNFINESTTNIISLKEYLYGYTTKSLSDILRSIHEWVIISDPNITLSQKGQDFFDPPIQISEKEYEDVCKILSLWNSHTETTTHKIKPYYTDGAQTRQTKSISTLAQIITKLQTGVLHDSIKSAIYHKELVGSFEPMLFTDIYDTVKDYCFKFSPEYYPHNKNFLPTNILQFFMNYRTKESEFFTVYWDGVKKKSEDTCSMLEGTGLTGLTLKAAYDTLLTQNDRNSEQSKYIVQKQIVLLYKQWGELVRYLDMYYLWNVKYHKTVRSFNIFCAEYLRWISANISGERFPMYLQVKEGHEIYKQFSAWVFDTHTILLQIPEAKKEYLLNKMKKYKEKK